MIFIGGFFLGGKTFSAKSFFPQTPFPKVWGSVAEDIFLNLQYMVYFSLRPPKLVNLKYANRLQTVSKRCYVRQGVKSQRHLNEDTAENIIFTNNIYMGASAEISPRASLGRNDVIYLFGRIDVI